MSKISRTASGFDLTRGDRCSRNAYNWAKKTFHNRDNADGAPCLDMDGAFSNMLDFHGLRIGISSDGIGTKIELAERSGCYHTLGYDLLAMVVDDLITSGFEPTNVSNILDVDYLDEEIVDALMRGLYNAANEARIAVSGGEIAELGGRICGYGERMHCNWCATAIGVLHPALTQPITGHDIQPGDIVIALQSRGFRSNGFSLIRKIMTAQHGDGWHTTRYDTTQTWGEALLTPSRIYAPGICALLESGVQLKGIAHITGGGIIDNFMRVLRVAGVGANLPELFAPLDVMQRLQTLGNIPDETAYRYWNMGNGMLLVVNCTDSDTVVQTLAEQQYPARIAGNIVTGKQITLPH